MDLTGLAAFLASAQLVVGADTGPVHLASALGTPVAAIFGPTDPDRNGPLGVASRTLTADMDCRPCMQRKCRKKAHGPAPCVEQVEPSSVYRAAQDLLKTSRSEA
jgi:ADP-heptose:LPS heptosyltransferase